MADQVSRAAARWATVAAVPVALLAGLGAFAVFGGFDGDGDQPTTTATTGATAAPQATDPVRVAAPTLAERAATVCRALLSQLPDELGGRTRRPVTAGAEQNAAYGDPPITLECGVPAASFPPTDTVYALDRVCWHSAPGAGGTVWTTVDREVPVRVTVPDAYDPPGQRVIDFSAPLVATVPSADPADIPTGCNP